MMEKKLLCEKWKNKQQGIGLLEIIIALLISSIMLLAITNMYGKFIQASKQQTEQSNAQDQANFAFLALNRAIRMSGAGICVKPIVKRKTYFHQWQDFENFPPLLASMTRLDDKSRFRSFSNPNDNALGLSRRLTAAANSDALMVIYSDDDTRTIDAVIDTRQAGKVLSPQEASPFHPRRLVSPRETSTKKNDPIFYNDGNTVKDTWVMVSDCEHTGVYHYDDSTFQPVKSDPTVLPPPSDGSSSGNPNNNNFLYNFSGNGQKSLIARLHGKLFFVAEDNDKVKNLYEVDLLAPNPKPEPIAAFVQRMTVEYLNPDTRQWISSTERTTLDNWDKEWPIRVTLYMYAGSKTGNIDDDQIVFSRILDIRN